MGHWPIPCFSPRGRYWCSGRWQRASCRHGRQICSSWTSLPTTPAKEPKISGSDGIPCCPPGNILEMLFFDLKLGGSVWFRVKSWAETNLETVWKLSWGRWTWAIAKRVVWSCADFHYKSNSDECSKMSPSNLVIRSHSRYQYISCLKKNIAGHARDSTIKLHQSASSDLQKCRMSAGRYCPAVLIPGEDVILGDPVAELHLLQKVC